MEAEFDQNIFIPTGTYLREFMETQDELFPSGGMWGSMYIVDIPDVYKKMNYAKELGDELSKQNTLDDISGTFGFAVSFERFVNKTIGKDKNYPTTALEKTQFYELLAQFLHTDGRGQVDSLRFKEELTCKAEAPELRIFSVPYRHKK